MKENLIIFMTQRLKSSAKNQSESSFTFSIQGLTQKNCWKRRKIIQAENEHVKSLLKNSDKPEGKIFEEDFRCEDDEDENDLSEQNNKRMHQNFQKIQISDANEMLFTLKSNQIFGFVQPIDKNSGIDLLTSKLSMKGEY